MKTSPLVPFTSTSYTITFLCIYLGSLLFPLVDITTGVKSLLDNKFLGKLQLVNVYTESRLLLGDQVYNRFVVGRDGWTTLTDGYALIGYQNTTPLSPEELLSIQKSLETFQEQVESTGSVFLLVIPPDKQSIYPEHIPNVIPRIGGSSRLDQLLLQFQNTNPLFPILDLRPALIKAKKTYPVYYATDTHWNPIGAFFAYQEIIKSLQPQFSNLLPHEISDYQIVIQDPILFNVAKVVGSTSLVESPVILDPLFEAMGDEFHVNMLVENSSVKLFFSSTNNSDAPTALIFGDSFLDNLRPFISEHFSRAIYVHHLATSDLSYLDWCEQFQPDVVIFEITERNIGTIPVYLGMNRPEINEIPRHK